MVIEKDKLIVYVAHPYGGLASNKESVDKIMSYFVEHDKDNVYLSPIHNYGMLYYKDDYVKGLEICLRMLEECNVLVLCGDWQKSKGCIGEWVKAKAEGIDMYEYHEWVEYLERK